MYCSNCGEDANHGSGNCPNAISSFRSEKELTNLGKAVDAVVKKNKTILLRPKENELVIPEGKVLIDLELYNQLMEFSHRLDKEREAHTKYMREYRERKSGS